MIELYRAKYDKPVKYHFYYYTIVVNGNSVFEIELSDYKEIHVISDGSTFNLGKEKYRQVDFEKSDLVRYNNEREILVQYFRRIGSE